MMEQPAKHVLITGAAKRVGRVMALTLARAGWDVTVHYNRSQDEAAILVEDLRALGSRVSLIQADLEKPEDIERLAAAFSGPFPFTAVVHNASLFERDENDPDAQRHKRVNEDAAHRLTESLFQALPMDTVGCAVYLLDNTPMPPFLSAYAQSRARVREALPSLARRYAPRLRVNAVAPGPTLKHPRESEAHFQKLIEATPLQKAPTPEDIAAAVLFLLETSCVTGQILNVDSGAWLV